MLLAYQHAKINRIFIDHAIILLNEELNGTSGMPTRDTADSSSSRMDMTRMCLRWRSETEDGGNNIYVQ